MMELTCDDFDVYFKRAAEVAAMGSSSMSDHQSSIWRRESMPQTDGRLEPNGNGNSRRTSTSHHSRTASCKYPHRRATAQNTVRHSNSVSPGKDKLLAPSSSSSGSNWQQAAASVTCSHSTTKIRFQPADDDCNDDVARTSDEARSSAVVSSRMLRAPSLTGGGSFSCRSKSAPHSRSSSWKKIRRPPSARDLSDCPPSTCAERRESVSFEEAISAKLNELKLLQADDCYVVRQFDTSPKGALVNRGDSIKRRRHRTASNAAAGRPVSESCQRSAAVLPTPASTSISVGDDDDDIQEGISLEASTDVAATNGNGRPVKVVVLGEEGVGKTALLQQFMTSDYMAAVQTNFDYECEKTVSVMLNNTETILDFVENNDPVFDVEQFSEVEAFVLVFSITAQQSFYSVVSALNEIQQYYSSVPVIVVANKTDLVRTRQVSEEAVRELSRWCHYCEVSAALNHRVDELLVTVVTAVRSSANRGSTTPSTSCAGPVGCGGDVSPTSAGCTTRLLSPLLSPSTSSTSRQHQRHQMSPSSTTNCVRNAAGLLKGFFTRQKNTSISKRSGSKTKASSSSRSCEYLVD